jgi:tRNA nucleotidyltransferase (CCA-adding enzyme)
MPLTNQQLRTYDADVLRLPADKRKAYHAQVDRLIKNLSDHIKDRTDIKITKVVKAGSFAKFTILRKTSEDAIDVDVVFYICGKSADHETLTSLGDLIYNALVDVYPSKSVEDFEIQRRAAKVVFIGSGLSVDIVPVIEDPDQPGYGWQYDITDGSKTLTCAPCAIKFVRDRKNADSDFRTLVRLAKRWRTHAELKHLKSFVIELIMAHVLAKHGREGTIEERFRRFLWYVADSGLKDVIQFPENTAPFTTFSNPVVILDPVCSLNNVASRLTDPERVEIVSAAKAAWEAAHFASAENDNTVWKEIFGPRFKVEECA